MGDTPIPSSLHSTTPRGPSLSPTSKLTSPPTPGIGLMVANGASKVYIISCRQSVLEAAAAAHHPGVIIPLHGDVTSKESLANSGTTGPTLRGLKPGATLEELQEFLWKPSAEEFTGTLNVTAVFYAIVAFLPLLDAGNKNGNLSQKSQAIATSSITGFNRKPTGGFAYGTSKAAVTLLMKQFSYYLVCYGIRSNVIAPGIFPSELAATLYGESAMPVDQVPEGRAGMEEEMGGTVLWMVGKAGGYLNGNVAVECFHRF